MIFATVGAQMSFDRLITALDAWAGGRRRSDVFAQIGPTAEPPLHIEWTRFMDPDQFRSRMEEADVIVAHAGMGTILTALALRKPIIVVPRRGDLRETRNDHQFATAQRFASLGRVAVATTSDELMLLLDAPEKIPVSAGITAHASIELLDALRSFIGRRYSVAPVRNGCARSETPLRSNDHYSLAESGNAGS